MALQDVEKAIGINADSILVAVNPAYDKDGRRKFLVIERFFPNKERGALILLLLQDTAYQSYPLLVIINLELNH